MKEEEARGTAWKISGKAEEKMSGPGMGILSQGRDFGGADSGGRRAGTEVTKMDEDKAWNAAHRILVEFEELLTEKNIVIPSDDRTGDPDEARLFGAEYSHLQEVIVAIVLDKQRVLEAADVEAEDDWPIREVAIRIVDEFEELLAEKGIMVPSDDREGGEEEACLYGAEYYQLEDAVVRILVEEMAAGRKHRGGWNGPDRRAKAACEAMRRRMAEVPEGLARK